jgi:hypothetical protein
VPAASGPASVWVAVLAAFVARGAKLPVPTFFSTRKPVSLLDVSVQVNVAELPLAMVAFRFVGAEGPVAALGVAETWVELCRKNVLSPGKVGSKAE